MKTILDISILIRGSTLNLPATGKDIAHWANRDVPGYGNHGGAVDAGRDIGFWDLGMDSGIIEILKKIQKNTDCN